MTRRCAPYRTPSLPTPDHCDRRGPSIGNEMLNVAGNIGPHPILRWKECEDSHEDDARPILKTRNSVRTAVINGHYRLRSIWQSRLRASRRASLCQRGKSEPARTKRAVFGGQELNAEKDPTLVHASAAGGSKPQTHLGNPDEGLEMGESVAPTFCATRCPWPGKVSE
jgi:hypothetical protein